MNKTQLTAKLAERTELTKAQATDALNSVIEIIIDQMKDADRVILTGFGTFSVSDRAPRTGRNPQTGTELAIPAARVPKFKAGKTLKEAVG